MSVILPPLLNSIETENPFDSAVERIKQGKSGAGDFYWSTASPTTAHISIVLEPDVSPKQAAEMIPLALVALSDCLAVLLPPQVAVEFRESKFVVVNGGVAGNASAAISSATDQSGNPQWMVLSIMAVLSRPKDAEDPGHQPDITTLDEEGWENPDPGDFIETFARHFLSWMISWEDDGFQPVARAWKFKAEDKQEPDLDFISKSVQIIES